MRLKHKKFYIKTFGCQMNENDSEHISELLYSEGAQPVSSPEESDITIINTCAVREKSEEKFFSFLGRLDPIKEKKNMVIGVAGCVAQVYKSRLWDKKPSIDFIVGPNNYQKIPQILINSWGEKSNCTGWTKEWCEISPLRSCRESRVSGYVTIMRGCNNFCSYCIVPYTRGREKYRPMTHILEEVKILAEQGYKEVQLLGQNVNSYQDPQTGKNLASLLKEVNSIPGIEWIRFLTSHPKNFTLNIAQAMKEAQKVCPQLHLPVQSGSTSVLKRMNRHYTKEDYLELINMLKQLIPKISLSTDIMVGYPGETAQDFRDTLDLLQRVEYTNIFSFRYSPRPLTPAYKQEDSVPFEVKKKRLIELQNLQKNIQLKKNKSLVGQTMKVLCRGRSKKDPHVFSGRNRSYQVVNFSSSSNVIGRFVKIRITDCSPYSLFGKIVH